MKRLAVVVSRLFDPVVMVPLLLVVAAFGAFVNGERYRYLSLLVIVDGVLPGFVLFYFIQRGRILSGWDVKKREERLPLFMFVVLAHLVGVLGAWFLDKHPLAEYLTSFWLLTVIYAIVTHVWKISVHAGVMSALATFMVLTQGPGWLWLYGLVLLVIWARVVGKYHEPAQALAGGAVPVLVMPVVFGWLGII